MSSLMQFQGKVGNRGVQLIAYLIEWYDQEVQDANGVTTLTYHTWRDKELIPGTQLPVLYTFWRKPCDQMGAWVGFRIDGEVEFPDLSLPMRVDKLPRGAQRVGDQAALRYWLEDNEHPMATALKAAVLQVNNG